MKATISQVFPRLALYREERFRGRRFVWRGNLGLSSLERLYRDDIESLRFSSPNPQATLVLFSRSRFRGAFKVFRGNTNIPDLDDIVAGEEPESIVMANRRLTLEEIRRIRRTGRLPEGFRTI